MQSNNVATNRNLDEKIKNAIKKNLEVNGKLVGMEQRTKRKEWLMFKSLKSNNTNH